MFDRMPAKIFVLFLYFNLSSYPVPVCTDTQNTNWNPSEATSHWLFTTWRNSVILPGHSVWRPESPDKWSHSRRVSRGFSRFPTSVFSLPRNAACSSAGKCHLTGHVMISFSSRSPSSGTPGKARVSSTWSKSWSKCQDRNGRISSSSPRVVAPCRPVVWLTCSPDWQSSRRRLMEEETLLSPVWTLVYIISNYQSIPARKCWGRDFYRVPGKRDSIWIRVRWYYGEKGYHQN